MSWIRQRRKELGKTQRQLAEELGVCESWLRDIERGRRLPGRELAERISAVLDTTGPVASVAYELAPALQRWFARLEPWAMPQGTPHVWALAERAHREVLGCLGNPELPDWFKQSVRCDSTEEPVGWLSLVAHGARACSWSPYLAGIAGQPLLDENRRALGVRRVPALLWDLRLTKALIFPQVHSRPEDEIYRSDAIAVVQDQRKRVCFALELDGKGHNPYRDKRQKEQFKMPIVRVSGEMVMARGLPEALKEQFRAWGFQV